MNEALKSLRSKKLMTQGDVADSLNISRQTYYNWENSVSTLTIDKIFKILDVLKATKDEKIEFFNAIQLDNMSNE